MIARLPTGVLLGALVLAGCPFELGSPTTLPGACKRDSDCDRDEACNAVTGVCSLVAPPPETGRVRGPVRCVPFSVYLSGAALSMAWDGFEIDGGGSWPEGQQTLDHLCLAMADERSLTMLVDGPRTYHAALETFGFYRVFVNVPRRDAKVGEWRSESSAGLAFFCPGFPKELAWSNGDTTHCWQVFLLGTGTVRIDRVDLALDGTGELAGAVDLDLVPVFAPPDADSGGACSATGDACESHETCCEGHLCVAVEGEGGLCMATCESHDDCSSGCCVRLDDGQGNVCAPAQFCE